MENTKHPVFNILDKATYYDAIIVVHTDKGEVLAQIPFLCEFENREEFDEALTKTISGLKDAYQFWPAEYVHIQTIQRQTYVNMV